MKNFKFAILFTALAFVLDANATDRAKNSAEMLQNMQQRVQLTPEQSAKAKVIFDHYFELKSQCEKQYKGDALLLNLKKAEKESIASFKAILTTEQLAAEKKKREENKTAGSQGQKK